MRTRVSLVCAVVLMTLVPLRAADEEKKVDQRAMLAAVEPATVVVEFHLRFDKGEPPRGGVAGSYGGQWYGAGEQSIREERPFEVPGWLVGKRTVITADVNIDDRFIEKVTVRKGEARVDAKPAGRAVNQAASFLELAGDLAGAKPLSFDADAKGPFRTVVWHQDDGEWEMGSAGLPADVVVTANGRAYVTAPTNTAVVNGDGKAVGMAYHDGLPADGSWKGSPLKWERIDADAFNARLDATRQLAERGLLRVTLNFRSPRKDQGPMSRFSYGDDDEDITELNTTGVVVGKDRVLVLASLKPKVTARLERVRVFDASGEARSAKFIGSLTNYGALVVEPEKPFDEPLTLDGGSVLQHRGDLMTEALVRVQGEQRTAYVSHDRIEGYYSGWRGQLYPSPAKADVESFLFALDGKLVTLPIARREPVSTERRWDDGTPEQTAAKYLADVMKELDKHVDANNVPLSEEDANRVAWLGVVLQPLDQDLARLNNVADLSQDGQIGGLVTYVYPGSPAAEAGVEPGAILLRIHPEGHPRPIDVSVDEDPFGGRAFPWERLDEVPEQFYDQIPTPWPTVETTLATLLTELGWDTAFAAEFFVDGQPVRKEFKVAAGPKHYESAKRYESKELGITVRNVTYEVRRYLQLEDDAPGVVVGKIEPGSKGSVAGLKPFELVTAVNDTEVKSVDEFEKALASAGDEARLSVKRMTRSRQVAIKLDGKPAEPVEDAEDADDDAEN